jgi:EAL domain-containing protein (putative c-di-GMP-specific phosphodiesterase class I)
MGVALNDPSEIDAEQMLANADTAMYSVKAATRDGYSLYTRERHSAVLEDYDLEQDLRAAIDDGQLELHYQPQVRIADGRVAEVEALVRWNHPTRGMLAPGRFIPMAEETGLILPVGEWVLRTACAQHRAWRDEGLPHVRMAVNISYRQMAQPHLPHMIEAVLSEFGMSSSDLVLEIAEMDIIRSSEAMRRSLDTIHASGVQLAVDDFGRGYGAVGHLHGLPIDTLKVNRCAVPDADEATSGAVASAVVQLAAGLSLETVISCVESEDQLRRVLQSSCEGVQGFVFSRAMPADELPEILRSGFNVPR